MKCLESFAYESTNFAYRRAQPGGDLCGICFALFFGYNGRE